MHFLIIALVFMLPCSAFAQASVAKLKVQNALYRQVTLDVSDVQAADIQRPDRDRATLTQDLEKTRLLYANFLRANTTPGKTAEQRIMSGARYWELIGNTGTPTELIAVLEKRSGTARLVAGIVKRAMPVLEMESDAVERVTWLQRFAVLENSLRVIAANPHNASSARFDLKRHLTYFETGTLTSKGQN